MKYEENFNKKIFKKKFKISMFLFRNLEYFLLKTNHN